MTLRRLGGAWPYLAWPRVALRAGAVWGLVVALSGGCGVVTRMTAPTDEVTRYRQSRTAATFEERLLLASAYLQRYPDGAYADDVSRWFRPAEARFFEQHWDTAAQLERYLVVLPRGPHAEVVERKLADLRREKVQARKQDAAADAAALARLKKLEIAEKQRRAVLDQYISWVTLLGSVRSLGAPETELPEAFTAEFPAVRDGQAGDTQDPNGPVTQCGSRGCTRTVQLPYAVPSERGLLDRVATMTLGYEVADGHVVRVFLTGYGLFNAVGEARSLETVERVELLRRVEAIATSLDITRNVLEPRFPLDRCAVPAVAPVVLSRACDGVELWVVAGPEEQVPDFVELREARKPAPGPP